MNIYFYNCPQQQTLWAAVSMTDSKTRWRVSLQIRGVSIMGTISVLYFRKWCQWRRSLLPVTAWWTRQAATYCWTSRAHTPWWASPWRRLLSRGWSWLCSGAWRPTTWATACGCTVWTTRHTPFRWGGVHRLGVWLIVSFLALLGFTVLALVAVLQSRPPTLDPRPVYRDWDNTVISRLLASFSSLFCLCSPHLFASLSRLSVEVFPAAQS